MEDACADKDVNVWVAVNDDSVVGFVAAKLHPEDSMGEITMVAVEPDFQGQGIGSALIEFAYFLDEKCWNVYCYGRNRKRFRSRKGTSYL